LHPPVLYCNISTRYNEALRIWELKVGRESKEAGTVIMFLGMLREQQGRMDEAEVLNYP
jgi:hypothetical protein